MYIERKLLYVLFVKNKGIVDTMINSHIQMPKCILSRFEENNRFYYYDVEKKHIGKNGHAKSINTKRGYYSQAGEDYLRNNIETPIGELLKEIDRFDFNQPNFEFSEEFNNRVRRLFYSLISRSPSFQNEVDKNSDYFSLIHERDRHDYVACVGIELAEERKILDAFTVTISMNTTNTPFILPTCGIYSFAINDDVVILLPVSKSLALTMVMNKSRENDNPQNNRVYYEFDDDSIIMQFNKKAFKQQIEEGTGYVVSADYEELNRAKCANGIQ